MMNPIHWWTKAGFGIFIHWGVYSLLAGEYKGQKVSRRWEGGNYAEWIMANAEIPLEEYARIARKFNPVDFDPKAWVKAIKSSGARYVVITTKHHDGFCLFQTKQTNYNICDFTPLKQNIIQELSRECKKAKIKFGCYYSILDWHHESQQLNLRKKKVEQRYIKARMRANQKSVYVDYMKKQLKELISQCDPDILWFDGEWVDWWTKEDGAKLLRYLKRLSPRILVNNRVGKRGPGDGDFGTPEQEVPVEKLGYPWESCMTMNNTWGFSKFDKNWKSAQELLRTLEEVRTKGGNFLLNVGPTAKGVIPKESVKRLLQMGEKLNSMS